MKYICDYVPSLLIIYYYSDYTNSYDIHSIFNFFLLEFYNEKRKLNFTLIDYPNKVYKNTVRSTFL